MKKEIIFDSNHYQTIIVLLIKIIVNNNWKEKVNERTYKFKIKSKIIV